MGARGLRAAERRSAFVFRFEDIEEPEEDKER